jgi:branched-subunit amino acid aminotransferase/4-amino-4-deoxychorismate lyase
MGYKLLELWLNGRKCIDFSLPWDDSLRHGFGCSTSFSLKMGELQAPKLHFERLKKGLAGLNFHDFNLATWHELIIKPLKELDPKQNYRINVSIYPEPFYCLVSIYPLLVKQSVKLHHELIDYTQYAGTKLIKHKPISYLPSLMARMDHKLSQEFDFIWSNQYGEVIDASTSAIICYHQGKLLTPRQTIIKSISLDLLLNDFNFKMVKISKKILEESDEIMLLNSVQGVLPCEAFGVNVKTAYKDKTSQTNLIKQKYSDLCKEKI